MNWLPGFAFVIAVFVAEAAVIPNTKRTRTRQKDQLCQLAADTGPCTSTLRRWYFDSEADECKTFIWGGCGGNENRFRSRNRCERRCKDQPADLDGDLQQPRINLTPAHSRRCPPLRCGESGTDCPHGSMHVFSTDASDCPVCTCRPVTTTTATTTTTITTTTMPTTTTEEMMTTTQCPPLECTLQPCSGRVEYSQVLGRCPVCECVPDPAETSQLTVTRQEDESTAGVHPLWSCRHIECAPRDDCRVVRKTDSRGCVISCECEENQNLEELVTMDTLPGSLVVRERDETTEVQRLWSCPEIECAPRSDCTVIRKTDPRTGCILSCACEENRNDELVIPDGSMEVRPVVQDNDETTGVHMLWSCRLLECAPRTDCTVLRKTDARGCVLACECEEENLSGVLEIPGSVEVERPTQASPVPAEHSETTEVHEVWSCPEIECAQRSDCTVIRKSDPRTGCVLSCACEENRKDEHAIPDGSMEVTPVAQDNDETTEVTEVHMLWSCRLIECVPRTDCTVIRKTDPRGCVLSCDCEEENHSAVLEIPGSVEVERPTQASPVPPEHSETTEVHAVWSCREIECAQRSDCMVIRKTDPNTGCVTSCECEDNSNREIVIPDTGDSSPSIPDHVLCPEVICQDSEQCRGIHKIDPQTGCTVCGCADSTQIPLVPGGKGETTEVHALWSCRYIECFERTDCTVVRRTDPRTGCVVSCDCEETVEEARRDDCARCDDICYRRRSQVAGCDDVTGCRCRDDDETETPTPRSISGERLCQLVVDCAAVCMEKHFNVEVDEAGCKSCACHELEHIVAIGSEVINVTEGAKTTVKPAMMSPEPEVEHVHCENQLTCHPICTAIRDERGCDVACRCEDLDGTLTVEEEEAPAAASPSVQAAEPETMCLAIETRCRCNPGTEVERWSVDENGCRICACAEVTLTTEATTATSTTVTTTIAPETTSACAEVDCGECEGGATVTSLNEDGCSICACVQTTTTTTTVATSTSEKSEVDFVVANARKSTCSLPEERGTCRGNIRRWRYDVTSGTCVTFSYGGCRGNANNFRSEHQCARFCSPHVNAGRRESRSRFGRILGLLFRR